MGLPVLLPALAALSSPFDGHCCLRASCENTQDVPATSTVTGKPGGHRATAWDPGQSGYPNIDPGSWHGTVTDRTSPQYTHAPGPTPRTCPRPGCHESCSGAPPPRRATHGCPQTGLPPNLTAWGAASATLGVARGPALLQAPSHQVPLSKRQRKTFRKLLFFHPPVAQGANGSCLAFHGHAEGRACPRLCLQALSTEHT